MCVTCLHIWLHIIYQKYSDISTEIFILPFSDCYIYLNIIINQFTWYFSLNWLSFFPRVLVVGFYSMTILAADLLGWRCSQLGPSLCPSPPPRVFAVGRLLLGRVVHAVRVIWFLVIIFHYKILYLFIKHFYKFTSSHFNFINFTSFLL